MQLKVYIIFFFICTFLSKIIFRVSFRRLEKRLINNSTRMRRCTGAKKKKEKKRTTALEFRPPYVGESTPCEAGTAVLGHREEFMLFTC